MFFQRMGYLTCVERYFGLHHSLSNVRSVSILKSKEQSKICYETFSSLNLSPSLIPSIENRVQHISHTVQSTKSLTWSKPFVLNYTYFRSLQPQSFPSLHKMLFSDQSEEKKLRAIQLYVKNGGDINLQDSAGHSPLYYAIKSINSTYEIINALFKHGAIINHSEYHQGSPLHDIMFFLEIKKFPLPVIRALIEHSSINQRNSQGHTPLFYALYFNTFESKIYEILSTFFNYGAIIYNDEYKEGSPLFDVLYFIGSKEFKLGAIKALIENGCPINVVDERDRTPLDYVYIFKSNANFRSELVIELKKYGAH